ncbi:TSL-kinase interacting protein 1 [Platanthera zijinensis]|uniref:TSL-kinase interacting protein 1 n=1 Tax=Platanthera zijinensis TaxID=2320716 RepID=A0AAP0BMJ2_9ASPA
MMHAQSQVALEIHIPSTESSLLNGDYNFHSSPSLAISTQKPVDTCLGQKRTRQWAAWTRQEQENFFSALRQVGKNFEKITCRVQSKNKNQVRHYYYRLVRRMNKLLSPGFCLDAKNSKDTNAAMLRWWSLLEKYSCTPSKLHLKPRRFKIFIEALESQLLKDRKKARRKRPCQENCLGTSTPPSFLRRFSEHDFCGVKAVVTTNAENTSKLGINRGHSMKRNTSSNVNFRKRIFSTVKATGQKQRIGLVEAAAYKRWEKAAMAGVSLVADAAEQLERVANRENCTFTQNMPGVSEICCHGVGDTIMQTREKLKLQLFPIDEDTRQSLEKGAYNPFLELTLSARKRISSVLEHLNRKWGIKSIDSGELFLLPYSIQQDELAKCQRWTIRDVDSTAGDVHSAIGNPSIFRLRYGWFSGTEPRPILCDSHVAAGSDDCAPPIDLLARFISSDESKTTSPIPRDSELPGGPSSKATPLTSVSCCAESRAKTDAPKPPDSLLEPPRKSSSWTIEKTSGTSRNLQEDMVDPTIQSGSDLLVGVWADSLTNISVGDLLFEGLEVSSQQNAPSIQHTSISCDSFDAAVAAHSYCSQLPVTSVWNSEETCDEFSFKEATAFRAKSLNPSTDISGEVSKDITISACSSESADCYIGDPKVLQQEPAKDVSLSDLYWSDSLGSLGQLDLDLSFPKYQPHDLCFSESISQSSFNRLIAGNLDLFPSSLHPGTDKKAAAGAHGEASAVDDDDRMDL